ncbi:MAG: thioredoxin 1 [Frankiales bacterium]|jgi:thioredoxin 1|nr:thioredoxin 1 [Frankiales bacterium]
MSHLPTTTDATFASDVLASETPVLVDFTADWCPPCKMVAPTLERIAEDEAGRMQVVSIDADTNPETVRAYGVMGLPTLALFVGGELVAQVVGARSQPALMKAFEPHL